MNETNRAFSRLYGGRKVGKHRDFNNSEIFPLTQGRRYLVAHNEVNFIDSQSASDSNKLMYLDALKVATLPEKLIFSIFSQTSPLTLHRTVSTKFLN